MKNLSFILSLIILAAVVLGCGGQSKTEEVKSGRLNYVKTLKYGPAGTHGNDGWYVTDRNFYVNGKSWTPEGIKTKEIGDCHTSPNEAVEVLKCYDYSGSKRSIHILRMKNDKPEWLTVSAASDDHDSGIWVGDGHWLFFKDFYFNVETSERREIKGLPDFPENHFLAASPDLETIIYEESCLMSMYDAQTGKQIPNERLEERCKKYEGNIYTGVAAFWLIEARTGSVKILELKEDKYPSLKRGTDIPDGRWSENLKKMLVWEKDKNGKDQLVYPN